MASNGFSLNISEWAKQTQSDIALVVRKTALDMFSRIVMRSPVDTGRFRNNWNVSIGKPVSDTNEGVDPSGGKAIGKIAAVSATYKLGDTIWMSNGLPYAWRLETGWSKQAPAGMTGVTVQEFQAVFDKAAKSTKSFA